jgi:tubulin-specific chaperone D
LSGTIPSVSNDIENDIDVPEEVELILEQLFQGLQDKVGQRADPENTLLMLCS